MFESTIICLLIQCLHSKPSPLPCAKVTDKSACTEMTRFSEAQSSLPDGNCLQHGGHICSLQKKVTNSVRIIQRKEALRHWHGLKFCCLVDLTRPLSEGERGKHRIHFPGAVTPPRQLFSTFCKSVACRRNVAWEYFWTEIAL